jgi:CHAT domain-containing protein
MLNNIARAVFVLFILVGCGLVLGPAIRFQRRHSSDPATRLLEEADEKAWLNAWLEAAPLYRQAEKIYENRHDDSRALYARVSQIPADSEHSSLPDQIMQLTRYLDLPPAKDYDTRLRILGVRGFLEVNYDAGMTSRTYAEIERMAWWRGHILIAARAIGEQGIADFLTGNIASAKRKVVYAWMVSKILHDPAAHIRYASLYAEGLVRLGRYEEARKPIQEAIQVATRTPGTPYPSMAKTSLVEALTGEGKYGEALSILNEDEQWTKGHKLEGHLFEVESSRGAVLERQGKTNLAIAAYVRANEHAKHLSYWRGINEIGGPMARALASQGQLKEALAAIDTALDANTHIRDELYFVPRNLAVKAEILRQMGRISESNDYYRRSTTLIESLLASAPTPGVERLLLADLSDVYSGYFISLSQQGRIEEAFQIIEEAHGRIETQAIEHHNTVLPHAATSEERKITDLNLQLINSHDPFLRASIEQSIYETELEMETSRLAGLTSVHPVMLADLQMHLQNGELLLEYVLGEPTSYVMAITHKTVNSYPLASRKEIEAKATLYLKSIEQRQATTALSSDLFNLLLGVVPEFEKASSVIVVGDGGLHALPFSALWDGHQYVIQAHAVSVVPSATVLGVVRHAQDPKYGHAFVGVAAWTDTQSSSVGRLIRGGGPELDRLTPLPASLHEVTAIAGDLPRPSDILSGPTATETRFKQLPLSDYKVLHLALHGYTDQDYPDRSALVFAPEKGSADDGLLQLREIRTLHLTASLVTLSACDSGVGPVGEAGVDNLANAFLDAGATTVVSSLWEVDDRATAQLMIAFYDNLAQGEGKSEALRSAKLHLIQGDASQPFYWAAFELSGEPAAPLEARN